MIIIGYLFYIVIDFQNITSLWITLKGVSLAVNSANTVEKLYIAYFNVARELWAQDENKDKDDDDDDDDESTLEIKLFSFTTIFYIVSVSLINL